ncbi:MAG: nucleotidyltransferase family protein [Saccharofermentanales bacterium]
MKALILAAGYATRLYPLTKDRPKALLEVQGKAILDYIASEIGTIEEIDEIIIISNDRFYEQFVRWADRAGDTYGKEITVINDHTMDETSKLGAIRDMWFAIDSLKIDEDVVVIAGDNLFTYKLKDSYDLFRKSGKDLILAKTMQLTSDLQRMAVGLLDENGIIVDMEEKPKNPKSDIAFFATYFYKRETLPMILEYLEQGNPPDAPGHFPAWLYMRKPVMAHLFDGECYDIGTFESYEDVQTNFKGGKKSQ